MSGKARVSHRSAGTKLPTALQCSWAEHSEHTQPSWAHRAGKECNGDCTVRESFVFPLLWMPDVSICLQFGEGEIPRGAGMEQAASYALSTATH